MLDIAGPTTKQGAHNAVAPTITVAVSTRGTPVIDLLRLIRPRQWSKNLLVVPLAAVDGLVTDPAVLARVALVTITFIMGSAIIYIVNDVVDRKRDRLHPTKRDRPIAAGRIGVGLALAFAGVLAMLLVLIMIAGSPSSYWPLMAYLALNIAYSAGLKHVPLVDVFVVATGFVLRVLQGYQATGTTVSDWLLVTVFGFCLLLSLGKRRKELTATGVTGHRPALRGYSVALADQLILLFAGITAVGYWFYVRDHSALAQYGTVAAILSLPCALFALCRYIQVIMVGNGGGDPGRTLLGDKALRFTALLWSVLVIGVPVLLHHK